MVMTLRSLEGLKLAPVLAVALSAGCATMGGGSESGERAPVFVGETAAANEVPAGTQFAIRVNEAIETDKPVEGRTFGGELAQDIRTHAGGLLAAKGSPVELTVIGKDTGGGVFDTSEMTLAVRTITVNGRKHTVSTEDAAQRGEEGVGINKRTGIYTGGGAAIGTVLGAVVGGTSGAVIGGVVGAGAGAAAQILTQGKEVKIPAGSEITFKLDQSWYLRPATQQTRPSDDVS